MLFHNREQKLYSHETFSPLDDTFSKAFLQPLTALLSINLALNWKKIHK